MKSRYFFIAAIVLAFVSIIMLRYNSQHAVDLSNQIINKDDKSQPVTEDITELRQFVFTHMNSSVSFELNSSYERAVEAAKQTSQAAGNGDVYQQAQAACGQEAGTNSVAQVQCVETYLAEHLQPGDNPQPANLPDRSLYTYSYTSPGWSADLAGWSLLAAITAAIAALALYAWKSFRTPTLTN